MNQLTAIAAAAALHDPLRRRLLDLVESSASAVTRDAAAEGLGVSRNTVAFHLDRLVDAGLLLVDYEKANRRAGPGSGRPAKTYTRAPGEFTVSVPERHYDLMGDLLAGAIAAAAVAPVGGSVLATLRSTAAAAGTEAGRAAGSFSRLLEQTGYDAVSGSNGTTLVNCPFHALARQHTEVVCTANHSFLCAAAEATGVDPEKVLLEPDPAVCCVRIAP